jgi:hypothetical protein
MLEQICNPLAISDIGLSSRYLLDVLRIDQQEFELAVIQAKQYGVIYITTVISLRTTIGLRNAGP